MKEIFISIPKTYNLAFVLLFHPVPKRHRFQKKQQKKNGLAQDTFCYISSN